MNPVFFEQVAQALATERLDAYRQDGAAPAVALARYVWNMALCEALYSPLQLAEVALRNTQHRALTTRFGTEAWYDVAIAPLPDWQWVKIAEALSLSNGAKVETNLPARQLVRCSPQGEGGSAARDGGRRLGYGG